MGKDLFKEIRESLGKGSTVSEMWDLILKSPFYQKAWKENSPLGRIDIEMWRFLLSPIYSRELLKWEKASQEKDLMQIKWWEVLLDYPEAIRLAGLKLLHKLNAENTIPALLLLLRDKEDKIRKKAIKAIGVQGIKALEASKTLHGFVGDKDPELRQYAIWALGNIGKGSKEAIPNLIISFKNQTHKHPVKIINQIGNLGEETKKIAATLIHSLHDKDLYVSKESIIALGLLGQEARDAIPHLIQLLDQEEPQFEQKIQKALVRICREAREMLPLLLRYTERYKFPTVICCIIQVLGELGATDILLTLLKTHYNDLLFRKEIIKVLGKQNTNARKTYSFLVQILKDRNFETRQLAILTLGDLGKSARKAIPLLKKALRDPRIAKEATIALKKIQLASSSANIQSWLI